VVWPPQLQRPFDRTASFLRQRTPKDERILVWGWQPQFYIAAQRSPVTRMVDPGMGTPGDVLDDLDRYGPPAAVVLPGSNQFGVPSPAEVVYRLSRHPDLVRWLIAHNYVAARLPSDAAPYFVLLRPDLASTAEINAARPRSP
jgi:hypothetical protein